MVKQVNLICNSNKDKHNEYLNSNCKNTNIKDFCMLLIKLGKYALTIAESNKKVQFNCSKKSL